MDWKEWLGEDHEIGLDIANRKYRHDDKTLYEFVYRACGGNEALMDLYFKKQGLLGGRVNANRGLDTGGSYMNCYSRGFVLDDYKDIMQVAMDIGITFKGQGGQGVSMSMLRPKGSPIGQAYKSDGIIPFMKLFNEVTDATSQGGARKGALLISIDARHKEVMNFIKVKSELGIIDKANLSLEIDDEFMEAVQKYYDTGEVVVLHEKRNYSGHEVEYDVTPIEVFKALCENCYDWGDPAALYVNRFRNYNIMEHIDEYKIETCNPCGEQPLPKHGACCLASINLSEFVKDPYTDGAYFKKYEFEDAVRTMVKALDDIVEENYSRHPLKEQQEMSYNCRNIGIGVFGYATMLMKMGLKYGSPKALEFTDCLFNNMFRTAVIASSWLAVERGNFPWYSDKVWDSEIIRNHFNVNEIAVLKARGLRNCSLLSIAPAGTLSTLFGESSGCEPEFAISYTRRTVGMTDGEDTYYTVDCKAAKDWRKLYPGKEFPDYFVSSEDIPWRDRIATQAIMQKHVDTAISSTVNLPENATIEDVEGIYLEAWKTGCKGITIFRNNCKKIGILTTGSKSEKESVGADTVDIGYDTSSEPVEGLERGEVIKCSDEYIGLKRTLTTGCGSLHCKAFFDPETKELREVFLSKGSQGGCNSFMIGLSRMISVALRGGVSAENVIDQLESSPVCTSYDRRKMKKGDTSKGICCPSAVGYALRDMCKQFDKLFIEEDIFGNRETCVETPEKELKYESGVKCPDCGADLVFEGGCNTCKSCGYSDCSG